MMLLGVVQVLRAPGAPLFFVLLWIGHVFGLEPVSSTQATSSLPESPHCGIQLGDQVLSGQPTQIDEFPWTAQIEFQKPDGSFGFHCDIEEIVVHTGYDTKDQSNANDIALIRFTRPVNYSQTVRPICLPLSSSLRNRSYDGLISYAVGWRKNNSATASEKKLKVEMEIKSLQECAPIYERVGILLKQTHMCAEGVRGKDTCSGDSYGPLMRQMTGSWYLIGVNSFGPRKCE
uniref:Peptidase S1 domain-containing protein n=1 Tax=Anopheles merus TaxID=30066 RepID=A0A182VHS4_ANOME